ncbi:MAG: hypothetical protein ABF932_13655 [Gluconobacter potus]|uniref:Bacteriophage protein n=1 Tax=Gluconobacter potus TaxID=2724927 RepID=A0ABR9YNH2_9PROT|nr:MULTISPECIES: hypothetical protein [Gluconobacter]MBF0865115.1 hypothetical protein [Gluconobacter sp. R71656]MBF0868376.1 hypothetical protein [Gluconobacter sp. R75628]MBF0874253.1 hypothetical protein [Gluconobacter sp. R75629]MBF0883349.1 hypothetical protein [Gluconobacter potus]
MAKSIIQGSDRLRQTLAGYGKGAQGGILKRLLNTLLRRTVRLPSVEIGFFPDAAYPDGTYVAQVAFWDEYGTQHAPPRPFMRATIAAHQTEWGKLMGAALKQSGYDLDKALDIVGRMISDQVKEQIVSTDGPANSPVTNLLKQRFPTGEYGAGDYWQALKDVAAGETAPDGKVLVWSGRLLNSVSYEVSDD